VDAGLYEARHSFVWNLGADLVTLLDPQLGERILDLGCGTGQLTAKIADAGATVVGLDRSPAMIGQARQNYPGLQLQLADATDFSFPDKFDAVFSNAALHWVLEPEKAIRSIAASLRPNGRFVAEFGGKRNIARLLQAAETALGRRGLEYKNPWYFPSIGEYSNLLEQNGFEVTSAWHFDRFTPLDEGEDSMRDWIEMFGFVLLSPVPRTELRAVVQEMEEILRPHLYVNGRWHLDYVRLRIKANLKRDLPRSTRH
jgi:trans-aconitate methyltransferase